MARVLFLGYNLLTVKKLLTCIVIAASVLLAFGCARRVESSYKTIALVNSLLTDSLPRLRFLAESSGKPSGAIVLIGEPASCLRLSEKMMVGDEFDNIDARNVGDGLPDFAGETIVSILDFADSSTLSIKNQTECREVAVRQSLAALALPVGCKVLIICSSKLSSLGGEDVVDLFGRIGCEVPVIYSSDTTFSLSKACFLIMRERNMFTHNISYPTARLFMSVADSLGSEEVVVPFVDSLVPASFPDTVGVLAPNTYYSYVVQNQH